MTLTPAQLDEIATKLLRWKLLPCVHSFGRYDISDGHERAGLDVDSGHDAMLVLEAMGKWCGKVGVNNAGHMLQIIGPVEEGDQWSVTIFEWVEEEDDFSKRLVGDDADTPAGAIFACAAQLVGRM